VAGAGAASAMPLESSDRIVDKLQSAARVSFSGFAFEFQPGHPPVEWDSKIIFSI
jgi:hypothetical protein